MRWRRKGTMKAKKQHEGVRRCFRCARELAPGEGIGLVDGMSDVAKHTVFCNVICRSRPFDCPTHGSSGIYAGEGGPFCGLCEKRVRTWTLYAIHDVEGDDYWASSEMPTEEEQYH